MVSQGYPINNISDLNRLLGRHERPMRVEDFESISKTTLDDAKEIIAGKVVPSLLSGDEFTFATQFNYGFILNSKKPLDCPDVLIASPLLNRVRQLIYNRRPPNNIGQRQFDSLWAYLNIGDRKGFIDLFQDAEERFDISRGGCHNGLSAVFKILRYYHLKFSSQYYCTKNYS